MIETVLEVMTSPVATIRPTSLIDDALELMLSENVSGLPVTDGEGRLLGILSEYDVLSLLVEPDSEYRPIEPVVHYMTTKVFSIDEEASIVEAAEMLLDESIRRLPVLRDGRVVGILSRPDIARAYRENRRDSFLDSLPENLPTLTA